MKVFINGRFLSQHITGVQRYAIELVRALDRIVGEGRCPFTFEVLLPPDAFLDPGLRHIPMRRVGRLKGHAWEQLELPFHARRGMLFCLANMAPALAPWLTKANVTVVHDLSYRYFPRAFTRSYRAYYEAMTPWILRAADRVITVSESERAAITGHYPGVASRIRAIQNGGLPAVPAPASTPAVPDEPYLLYVGSLNLRKNFPGVLEAVRQVNRDTPIRLVVVGSVPSTFVRDFDLPPDLASRVTFLGQIDSLQVLLPLYQHARCFLFPSFYEASPLPPIEAMACGCPVVASRIPSLIERCGEAALYCNPTLPDDIATQVRRVLRDPLLAEELATRGRRQAARFTWERCAEATLEVLGEAMSARTGAAVRVVPRPA